MNMNQMMKQAKKMQQDLENKQKEIENTDFVGNSEWVTLTLKGDYNLKDIKINKENLDNDDLEILEDMITLAYNDALNKLKEETNKKLGSLSNLSGMF